MNILQKDTTYHYGVVGTVGWLQTPKLSMNVLNIRVERWRGRGRAVTTQKQAFVAHFGVGAW